MLVRTLFFLLLAANIGYYAWQVVNAKPVRTPRQAVDQNVPQLVLLREREEQLLASSDLSLGSDTLGDTTCFSLGPFATQADLRRAFNGIAPYIEKSRQRQSVQRQDRGYWVYLPAVPTREDALAVARDLSMAGLRDYYVVTAGDEENTVSLGVFRELGNAERRQATLKAIGYDAQLTRRTEESLVYWLDYSRAEDARPPWERVVASNANSSRRPIPCFR
jgi:hypothetical protein